MAGTKCAARTAKISQLAESIAREIKQVYPLAFVIFIRGITAYLEGRWKYSQDLLGESEPILRNQCTGVAWELDMARTFSLWNLTYLGKIRELRRLQTVFLNDAIDRGDKFLVTNLSTYIMAMTRLAADEPEQALRDLSDVMTCWSQLGFHVQHHNALLAQVLIYLYRGQAEEAFTCVDRQGASYVKSHLLRVQHVRIDFLHSRARSVIAAAAARVKPMKILRSAERDAKRLMREKATWAYAYAVLIQAGVAAIRGTKVLAKQLLVEAGASFEAADMALCAAAVRRQHGQLIGGMEGQSLIRQADDWMLEQEIKNPLRMAAMIAPGFEDFKT